MTISQYVTDFLATAAGRAVLSNAALKLLLKQDGATVDRLVALFDLTAEERQLLLAAGKGEGLLLRPRDAASPCRWRARPPSTAWPPPPRPRWPP